MAMQELDKNKIDFGLKLLQEIDKNPDLDIVSALWYYYPDLEQWQLLIYPPEFYKKIKDLKDFYRIIDNCLQDNPDIATYIKLSDIRLISDSGHNILGLLENIVKTPQKGFNTLYIGSVVVNGFYAESVLIYRNAI